MKLNRTQILGFPIYCILALAMLVFAAVTIKAGVPGQEPGSVPETAAPPLPPPPPPADFQNRIPSGQLAFLTDYAGKMPQELRKDKRFKALEKLVTPNTEWHYGSDKSLTTARDELLDTPQLPIDVRNGRYVMIATHGPAMLAGRMFLWFDIQDGIGLGGFYFHPSNGEPTPTVTVYSRQLTTTTLGMSQLPLEFEVDLDQWLLEGRMPQISPRYFIPANGRKYVLEHDEDYCGYPEGAPPPDPDECAQMNADAADADMNAAYFMQETHNQANATAWMLGPDQVEFLTVRTNRCGGALACRITVTRQRTGVLLGHPPIIHSRR
jgi:hypothetical protein